MTGTYCGGRPPVPAFGGWFGLFLAGDVQAYRWHCPGFAGRHHELALCDFALEREENLR